MSGEVVALVGPVHHARQYAAVHGLDWAAIRRGVPQADGRLVMLVVTERDARGVRPTSVVPLYRADRRVLAVLAVARSRCSA